MLTIGKETVTVEVVAENSLLIKSAHSLDVIEIARTGAQGLSGGASAPLVFTANEDISAFIPVFSTLTGVGVAKVSEPVNISKLIGISVTAALSGSNITVQNSGKVTNATWSWVEGSIYLGEGVLTQTPPNSGILQLIAVALSATEIIMDIKQPYLLP